MKKTKKKKTKWFATCWSPEFEIMVHPSGEDALGFIQTNGAQLLAEIELTPAADKRMRRDFKNGEICAISVSWKKYAKEFEHVASVAGLLRRASTPRGSGV